MTGNFCIQCGASNTPEARFCFNCGKPTQQREAVLYQSNPQQVPQQQASYAQPALYTQPALYAEKQKKTKGRKIALWVVPGLIAVTAITIGILWLAGGFGGVKDGNPYEIGGEKVPTTQPQNPSPTTQPQNPVPTTGPKDPSPTADPQDPSPTTEPQDPSPTTEPQDPSPTTGKPPVGDPGTWAIYWYMCGSDLESNAGLATEDLAELLKVTLPEKVKVVIETGGAKSWQNNEISSGAIGRYLYSGNRLTRIAEEPGANMGDPNTLAAFLQYCNANYPAERQAVFLWDHGGGSLYGVIFDEIYKYDSISIPELRQAFRAAPASSGKYEIIGFDACLMATIDTMDAVYEYARYMVAAEEVEPGCGWEYTGLFSALANNTAMNGAALGKAICDTFYSGCAALGQEKMTTLSVLDLATAPAMLEAFRALGDEALVRGISVREEYLSKFGGAALKTENYGGNNNQSGYFNMMDIGDFLANGGDVLLPKGSAAVRTALDDLVVYQINGELRSRANGLACYYSYDGDTGALQIYTNAAECPGFEYFYEYVLTGDLSEEGKTYARNAQVAAGEQPVEIQPLSPASELEGFPLKQQNGRYVLDVGERAKNLAGVYLHVMYIAEYDGEIDYVDDLGTCHAVDLSRQSKGIFTDTFNGKWAVARNAGTVAFSNPVYLAVMDRKPGKYTIYATPVLLNSEDYLLILNFDETNGTYEILGAKRKSDERARMAEKELRQLVPGDIIIPVQRMAWRLEDGSYTTLDWVKPTPEDLMYGGVFTLFDQAEFYDMVWLDGYYRVSFEMVDYAGNVYESEAGWYRFEENGTPIAVS